MAPFSFCVSLVKSGCMFCAKGLHGFWAVQRGSSGKHAALLPAQLPQPAINSEVAPENVLKGHKLNLHPKAANTSQTVG